jgi:hypothetical protein
MNTLWIIGEDKTICNVSGNKYGNKNKFIRNFKIEEKTTNY